MVYYGMMWYSMVGKEWCGVVEYDMVCYGMIRRSILWNDVV